MRNQHRRAAAHRRRFRQSPQPAAPATLEQFREAKTAIAAASPSPARLRDAIAAFWRLAHADIFAGRIRGAYADRPAMERIYTAAKPDADRPVFRIEHVPARHMMTHSIAALGSFSAQSAPDAGGSRRDDEGNPNE